MADDRRDYRAEKRGRLGGKERRKYAAAVGRWRGRQRTSLGGSLVDEGPANSKPKPKSVSLNQVHIPTIYLIFAV
jgi:hypothetical protein